MRLVEKRVCDRRVLKLLRQWLKAGVLDGGELLPTDQGVPQGGVISCVLANVVLHELDRIWEDRCSQLGQLIRYADDAGPAVQDGGTGTRGTLARRGRPRPSEADAPSDENPSGLCRGWAAGRRLSRRPLPQSGVLEVSGETLPPTVAVPTGDAAYSRRDQSDHCSPTSLARTRRADRGRNQPGTSPLGSLLASG